MPQLVAGLVFMIYPMVATTVTSLLVGGALITGALWFAIQAGW
jgi:hypothetical protein